MNDTWYSCEIRGDLGIRSDGILFSKHVVWNKESKTLTDIAIKSDKTSYNEFGKYDGNDLRVRLNSLQITLSGWRIASIREDDGFFKTQITYSEYKEGWFTKEIFFEVKDLIEWVYPENREDPSVDVSKDLGKQDLSKRRTSNEKRWVKLQGTREFPFFCVKAWDASPEKFDFKYLSEDVTLTLYDKCTADYNPPFRFYYERKCHFEIISSRDHDKEFFETLIRKITHFLSLCFGKKAVANHIWESDKQQWRWDYNPSEKENSVDFCYVGIPYSAISGEFGNKLTQWLPKYELYGTIIDCFFRDGPKVLPEPKTNNISAEEKRNIFETFFKRFQLLETYGNVRTKGKKTTEDLEAAVSAVDNEAVGNIIPKIPSDVVRLSSDGKSFQWQEYLFGKTPEDKKKNFVKIVTAFRNYFVHPFCNGKKKTPSSEGIEKFFTTAGLGSLGNFEEVTGWLSQRLSVILHCVLLESKNARESKGRTKPSQNLFPETNHTREDYGKIILKYLHQCLDDKGTSETLKERTARVKDILLFSREKATPETSDGENSESRCTDVVLTENVLRCLSDILTELTWRCEETLKEAFGKDEGQKIWALRPICECITHDFCGGSKGSSGKRQNLGELIINLKNSFDPNVNSLFCEQFTDYKNSDVNFKAFSRLTNILSDILHQLLLQEAGLTEFFEKKRMHRVPCRINV